MGSTGVPSTGSLRNSTIDSTAARRARAPRHPVGGHEALESPLLAQQLGEQPALLGQNAPLTRLYEVMTPSLHPAAREQQTFTPAAALCAYLTSRQRRGSTSTLVSSARPAARSASTALSSLRPMVRVWSGDTLTRPSAMRLIV